jgi:hypothetical protein
MEKTSDLNNKLVSRDVENMKMKLDNMMNVLNKE